MTARVLASAMPRRSSSARSRRETWKHEMTISYLSLARCLLCMNYHMIAPIRDLIGTWKFLCKAQEKCPNSSDLFPRARIYRVWAQDYFFLCSLMFPPEGVTINVGNLSETGQQCFQYVHYSVEWWQNLLGEYSLLVG